MENVTKVAAATETAFAEPGGVKETAGDGKPAADAGSSAGEKDRKLDLLLDLNLPVSIELGRTNLPIRSILDLQRGSVIEFEKLASEPVDILVNGKKMAEGEVVVIEKHFGIRITSLVEASERVRNLGK